MSESVVIFAWVRRLRAYLLRFPSSFSSCFPSLCFDLKCSIEFCAVCMRVRMCMSVSVCALNTWFEMVIQAVMDCASLTLLGYSAKFDGISVSLFAMLYSSHVVHAARTQPRVACRWLHTHAFISPSYFSAPCAFVSFRWIVFILIFYLWSVGRLVGVYNIHASWII